MSIADSSVKRINQSVDHIVNYSKEKQRSKKLEELKKNPKYQNSKTLEKEIEKNKKNLKHLKTAIKKYPSSTKVAIKLLSNQKILKKVQERLKENERKRRNQEALKKLSHAKVKIQNQRTALIKSGNSNQQSLDKLNKWEQTIDQKIGKYRNMQKGNERNKDLTKKKQKQNERTKSKGMSL